MFIDDIRFVTKGGAYPQFQVRGQGTLGGQALVVVSGGKGIIKEGKWCADAKRDFLKDTRKEKIAVAFSANETVCMTKEEWNELVNKVNDLLQSPQL